MKDWKHDAMQFREIDRAGLAAAEREIERDSRRALGFHYCANPRCPGYKYKASDIPHPKETCGE